MRKGMIFGVAILLVTLMLVPTLSGVFAAQSGTRIQDGILTYSVGHYLYPQPLTLGFDIFGYNYQAHMFNGYYPNVYLGREGLPPYEGNAEAYLAAHPEAASKWYWYPEVRIVMWWNDAWLSNMDRDEDGLLDRHYGYSSYIGSGAWETNHQWGTYIGDDNKEHRWDYFVKIVAAPADAYISGGFWYTADGTEIGPVIWTEFAIIESIYNDPYGGFHGVEYLSPTSAGFGYYD